MLCFLGFKYFSPTNSTLGSTLFYIGLILGLFILTGIHWHNQKTSALSQDFAIAKNDFFNRLDGAVYLLEIDTDTPVSETNEAVTGFDEVWENGYNTQQDRELAIKKLKDISDFVNNL